MSVRMRHTKGHTHNRRSHHALEATKAVAGEKAGTLRLPHRVDEATGLYRGKQIAQPAKIKKAGVQMHDHPHGTHHEHVAREERDPSTIHESQTAGAKPGEALENERENL